MNKPELDNLVRINRLKAEPASRSEFAGMVKSARTRLADLRTRVLIPTASLTCRMAQRTGWRSLRCVTMDIGQKTGLRYEGPHGN